jgi:hypothetical protein
MKRLKLERYDELIKMMQVVESRLSPDSDADEKEAVADVIGVLRWAKDRAIVEQRMMKLLIDAGAVTLTEEEAEQEG